MFAYAGLFGIDVETMITGDSFEFRVRESIVRRAIEIRDNMDDRLAVAIVNRLAQSLSKGRSS